MSAEPVPPAPIAADGVRQVFLQRVYMKDASLEIPLAPQVFTRNWNPSVDVQVGTAVAGLGDNQYEVALTVTVTAKLDEDVGFLTEVKQAGIFQLLGFNSEAELGAILGGYCPGVVFPFAREAIASLVQRGGFPPVLLQPINFDALYAQHVQSTQAQADSAGAPVSIQ